MIVLPPHHTRRHYRVKTTKGWRKLHHTPRTAHRLDEALRRVGARDSYYSTAWWLDPAKVGPAHKTPILLGADLVFDVDALTSDWHGYNQARRATLHLYDLMSDEPGFVLQDPYPAWTGGKGFRLVYTEVFPNLPVDPHQRLVAYKARRRLLVLRLFEQAERRLRPPQLGLLKALWDVQHTINPLGVIRLLGTTHGTTGSVSAPIDLDTLRSPAETHAYLLRAGLSHPAMTPQNPAPQSEVPQLQPPLPLGGRPASPLPPLSRWYAWSNEVRPGLYLPLLSCPHAPERPLHFSRHWKRVVRKARLGPGLLLHTPVGDYLLFSKLYQRRGLQALLDRLDDPLRHRFIRTGHLPIPFPLDTTPLPPRGPCRGTLDPSFSEVLVPLGAAASEPSFVHSGTSPPPPPFSFVLRPRGGLAW